MTSTRAHSSQAQQRALLAVILTHTIDNPGAAGGDRAQFPEDPFGGGEFKPLLGHFIMTKSTPFPSWQSVQSSHICPGLKQFPNSLPDSLGQRMPVWADSSSTSTVIAEQPGGITLTEQDGVFTVTDGDGQRQYTGNEIGAEFAFWRTTFGVPLDDGEVDQ